MAKSIMELRRAKGYFSAREFAEALGVSPSSMSRYEAQPDSMPIKMAWTMADLLDCSIDEIVGRDYRRPVTKNALDEFYKGLSVESRRMFDEYKEFLAHRDENVKRDIEASEKRKYERLASAFERMYQESAYAQDDVFAILEANQSWTIFDGLRAFVYEKLDALRDENAKRSVKEVIGNLKAMGTYDSFFDEVGEYPNTDGYDKAVELHLLAMAHRHMDETEGTVEEVTNAIMDAYDDMHPEMDILDLTDSLLCELDQ